MCRAFCCPVVSLAAGARSLQGSVFVVLNEQPQVLGQRPVDPGRFLLPVLQPTAIPLVWQQPVVGVGQRVRWKDSAEMLGCISDPLTWRALDTCGPGPADDWTWGPSKALCTAILCWGCGTHGVCSLRVCRTVTQISEGWACLGLTLESPARAGVPWGSEESPHWPGLASEPSGTPALAGLGLRAQRSPHWPGLASEPSGAPHWQAWP